MSRTPSSPGVLAVLLHTLRTEVEVPRRVLLEWSGVDEKQYGRWVREGQRPDRRGRQKLEAMFPHVLNYLERVGSSWDDVIDRMPPDFRFRSLRLAGAASGDNPLITAADLDADRIRGAERPEHGQAHAAASVASGPPATRSAGFGLHHTLEDVDAIDLIYALVAGVCASDAEAERLTMMAVRALHGTASVGRAHLLAYRTAVDVVAKERSAPPSSFRPSAGQPNTFLALVDPMLATAVVLADQELLPVEEIAEVFSMHIDYVQARVALGRRELLALGWLPS